MTGKVGGRCIRSVDSPSIHSNAPTSLHGQYGLARSPTYAYPNDHSGCDIVDDMTHCRTR